MTGRPGEASPEGSRSLELVFQAISEPLPGPKWQALFRQRWPMYRQWFLQEGERARPYYLTCLRSLRAHMPELLPTYERLVELAGGGDLEARFLALYCPPPYLIACSQAVWSGLAPVLVRNYDYSPALCEGVLLRTAWNGRRVIAMSDCLWGVLDGMNEDGLAVSLSFGGRREVGEGFAVTIVLRYILEFGATTGDAMDVLRRVPVHMTYNITVLDRAGRYVTAYLAPDRPAQFRPVAVATNHQERVEWPQHARATRTVERERLLSLRLRESREDPGPLIDAVLRPPIYSVAYASGFGTLYTAVYRPTSGQADYLWPSARWRQSFDAFAEGTLAVQYPQVPVSG